VTNLVTHFTSTSILFPILLLKLNQDQAKIKTLIVLAIHWSARLATFRNMALVANYGFSDESEEESEAPTGSSVTSTNPSSTANRTQKPDQEEVLEDFVKKVNYGEWYGLLVTSICHAAFSVEPLDTILSNWVVVRFFYHKVLGLPPPLYPCACLVMSLELRLSLSPYNPIAPIFIEYWWHRRSLGVLWVVLAESRNSLLWWLVWMLKLSLYKL